MSWNKAAQETYKRNGERFETDLTDGSNSQYDISVFLTSGFSVFRGFSGGRDGHG